MRFLNLIGNVPIIATLLIGHSLCAADSVVKLQESARHYIEAGDPRAALIELKNAQQTDPDNFSTSFLLSQIYAQMGRYDAAEQAIQSAKTKGLPRKIYVIWLGQYFLAQQKNIELLNQLTVQPDETDELRGEILALRTQAQLNLGELKDGKNKFEQALSLAPRSHAANWALARHALEVGDNLAADRHLTILLGVFPNDPGAQFLRAQLNEKRGSINAARVQYSKVLRINPNHLEARIRRANLLLAEQELNRAKEDIDWLLDRHPTSLPAKTLRIRWLMLSKHYDLAEAQIDEVLSADADFLTAIELSARVAMAKKNHEQAALRFKRYLERAPNHLEISMLYAHVQLQLGCSTCAISTLTKFLSSDSENTTLLTLLGLAYLESGDRAKGLQLLDKANFIQPHDETAKIRSTIQSIYSGKLDRAVDLARFGAMSHSLQSSYVTVLTLLTANHSDAAAVEAQRLVSLHPREPFAVNLLGLVKLYQSDEEAASELFNQALSINKDYVPALLNLAEIKSQQQDFDAAEALYSRASEQDPSNKQLLLTRARFYLFAQKNVKALQMAQQAWKLDGQDLTAGLMVMQVHLIMKNLPAAQQVAEQLLDSNADAYSLRKRIGDLYMEYEHWALALTHYQWIEKEQSAGTDTAESIVYALYQQQQYQQAWDKLQPMIDKRDLKPSTVVVAVDLAMRQGAVERAMDLANRVQQTVADEAIGYHLAAKIYLHQKHFSLAAKQYELAYEREPNETYLLQASRARLNANQADLAIKLLTDELGSDETNAEIRFALATLYHHLGQSTLAIAEYERLLAESSGSEVQIRNNLANLYLHTHPQKALRYAKAAYLMKPDDAAVLDTYAWVLMSHNQLSQAREVLQKAHDLNPNDPEISFHYAVLLHRDGKNVQAKSVLTELLSVPANFSSRMDAEKLLKQIGGSH